MFARGSGTWTGLAGHTRGGRETMPIRSLVESEYAAQTEAFVGSDVFKSLRSGKAPAKIYDEFIARLCRTHLNSPQILAFLYSLAPPRVAGSLKHNMLEELGLDEAGIAPPELWRRLAQAAGFARTEAAAFEGRSRDESHRLCA